MTQNSQLQGVGCTLLCPIRDEVLASHMHRSGWPYVMNVLEPLFSDRAPVVFDDFLEKTFSNRRMRYQNCAHTKPWVGVCHHPPDAPMWYQTEHLHPLEEAVGWETSLRNFRLCVTLAENVASWVRNRWGVPCVSIRHPTEIPELRWSPSHFLGNHSRMLLQVGWYLRNTYAIHQAHVSSYFRKAWLRQTSDEIKENHRRCGRYLGAERKRIGEVYVMSAVSDMEYDRLLSENVVFVELISAAANNTVVECIARNTPIVINRHPGPEYYLGSEYPLFYEDFEELYDLVTVDRVISAHEYLKTMQKGWLDGNKFREEVREACLTHVPELGADGE